MSAEYEALALRYSRNVSGLPREAGECFRYGAPLATLSELDLRSKYNIAWNLANNAELAELRAEIERRA